MPIKNELKMDAMLFSIMNFSYNLEKKFTAQPMDMIKKRILSKIEGQI